VAEMCLHFFEQHKIMVLKIASKFELRRIARAVGATCLVRIGAPTVDEQGSADEVNMTEISSNKVTVFSRARESSRVATIVLRASTQNILDDAERSVDDAVNVFRQMKKDGRFVGGAGAVETNLASKLAEHAEREHGLDQYSYKKFAEAFEVIPRTLAENAGENATEMLSKLYAANTLTAGININEGTVSDTGVWDHLESKRWAIRLAADCAVTILRVDQIIMSKPAGGPKPRKPQGDEDD
jgi:T-complex protein 1 subunit theta